MDDTLRRVGIKYLIFSGCTMTVCVDSTNSRCDVPGLPVCAVGRLCWESNRKRVDAKQP
ncbi:MAG: hypothetical protein DMG95_12450 [Acidobacteria bacterium]|nr:MAG: hypothetical protein DMG95_12450 [Acidobacteriota bacterium]